MRSNRRYLVAVASLAVLALVFGLIGTAAPPLAEETGPEPQQESSSESVGHFQNPPTYDSGWVNITSKAGQYFTLKHSLNTTQVFVDVTGKRSLDSMGGALAWSKTYGGGSDEKAWSVVQTGDGGYAMAGDTYSYGTGAPSYNDFWLVKTDSAGTKLWDKTYGGASYDGANSVVQTGDGGYAIAGYTGSFGAGGWDFWLVKTDSTGNTQWNKTYGGTGYERAYSVVQTSDGGYALAGYTTSYGAGSYDFWLVKTNSTGNMQWSKTYGGGSDDEAWSLVQTSDGGYALTGDTFSYGAGGYDFWLVKTDSTGNMQWSKTYGGAQYDRARSVVQTSDGGYALAGLTVSYGAGYGDFWLVKTDSTGNTQWSKTYGGAYKEFAYSLVQTSDGGYALAGLTEPFGTQDDFWLVKTDSTGNMQWNKTYAGASYDSAYSLVQTSDGGYALAGSTVSYVPEYSYDFWLVKVNAEMNLEHQRNLGSETGLVWTGLTNNSITLYRGLTDLYWNYVRVRIWTIKEPSWIYGDINMDGIVDAKDLYILGRNYGKSVSLLSLGGIIGIAGIHTVKKRKQPIQPSNIN